MRGSIVVSFLYDTLKTRTRTVELDDSRSTLASRLESVLKDEHENARKFGWTLVSHATTVVPEHISEDAPRLLLFEITGAKGSALRIRVLDFSGRGTPGRSLERSIEDGVNIMASASNRAGYPPVAHTVTFV